jgi:hypothetical protein
MLSIVICTSLTEMTDIRPGLMSKENA